MKPPQYREQKEQSGCWNCIYSLRIFMPGGVMTGDGFRCDSQLPLTCTKIPKISNEPDNDYVSDLGICPEHVAKPEK
jgi:hypothetical protein